MQALKMAINSLSVTWYLASVGVSFLLKNATGHYSCNSSAPRPTTDALQCIWNGLLKSGSFSTGAEVNLAFSCSKACYYCSPHTKGPLTNNKLLIGAAIVAKCNIKQIIVVCKTKKLLHNPSHWWVAASQRQQPPCRDPRLSLPEPTTWPKYFTCILPNSYFQLQPIICVCKVGQTPCRGEPRAHPQCC